MSLLEEFHLFWFLPLSKLCQLTFPFKLKNDLLKPIEEGRSEAGSSESTIYYKGRGKIIGNDMIH